jgi:hypothetical protein
MTEQEYKEKCSILDLIQRKSSLLVQGVQFLSLLQKDTLQRDILIEKYTKLLSKIDEVEI